MIEEKAEQLAEMMVEDRMKSGECKKMICQSEKEIWKKSAKKIEADFNKLLEHLKSQDIDIKFQKPKPGESSKEVTIDELNSILKNANQTSTLPAKTHNPDHRSFLNQLTTSTASKVYFFYLSLSTLMTIKGPNNTNKCEFNTTTRGTPWFDKPKTF